MLVAVFGWIFRKKIIGPKPEHLEPQVLSRICTREMLKDLGSKYMELSGENTSDTLLRLLAHDKNIPVGKLIHKEVEVDFKNNNTILIDGWLLSITEARQCALISLQNESK